MPVSKELFSQNLIDPALTSDAAGYRNFANLPLFGSGGPSPDDIRQQMLGTCYYLAALSAIARDNPDWVSQSIVSLGDGTYAVRFWGDSGPVYARVDADLPVSRSGQPIYDAPGHDNCIWGCLMEKAWASVWHRDTMVTSYDDIQGGWGFESLGGLGGLGVAQLDFTDFGDSMELLQYAYNELQAGRTVLMGFSEVPDSLPVYGSHEYSVVAVGTLDDGTPAIMLRNPWGYDTNGDKPIVGDNDGYVILTADDLAMASGDISSAQF